jgi:hypothetical protein
MSCEAPATERSGVPAAVLRQGRHGKREQSDCGPQRHGTILRPIEFCRLPEAGSSKMLKYAAWP